MRVQRAFLEYTCGSPQESFRQRYLNSTMKVPHFATWECMANPAALRIETMLSVAHAPYFMLTDAAKGFVGEATLLLFVPLNHSRTLRPMVPLFRYLEVIYGINECLLMFFTGFLWRKAPTTRWLSGWYVWINAKVLGAKSNATPRDERGRFFNSAHPVQEAT